VLHPATYSHRILPEKERKKLGISDSLIRLSVGIEHREDLKKDLAQALQQAPSTRLNEKIGY
jgi:cystathionine beta-lyase/cystathionine gamma-synthase